MNAPFNLVTAVTYRCNIKCRHCFASSPKYDDDALRFDEMSTAEWLEIVSDAGAMGAHEIYFGGGEPFFRKDFLTIVEGARKSGLGVTLTTNGVLMRQEKAQRLKELGVECVEVSVDGDEESHNYMRGHGNHAKALAAIRQLTDAGIYVIASMTLTARNAPIMQKTRMEVAGSGAREILYMRFVPTGAGRQNRADLYLTESGFRNLVAEEAELTRGVADGARRQSNSDGFFYPHAGCIPGRTYCFIRPNGDVTPCNPLIFPENRCGNLRKRRLPQIWRDGPGFSSVRDVSFHGLPGCMSCEKQDICGGGCRILCSMYKKHCGGICDDCQFDSSCNEATGLCGKKYMYYVRL